MADTENMNNAADIGREPSGGAAAPLSPSAMHNNFVGDGEYLTAKSYLLTASKKTGLNL